MCEYSNRRTVVRTLATSQGLETRTTLEMDNCSLYKDYCLVNWLTLENYGYIKYHRSFLITSNRKFQILRRCVKIRLSHD